MTPEEFSKHIDEHTRYNLDLNYCVIALNEEAGEVAGWYKKAVLRDNPTGKLTKDDLKGELGDVMFYLTCICKIMGWTLEEVMDANKAKLDERVAKQMKMVC